jgi:cytochrome c oxidase assembly protein subunit 15
VLLICTACLIALGGATRAMDAGLACPDWPLCFGQMVPDFHPQVYFEFIHRALAGSIGIFVLVLHGALFLNRSVKSSVKWVAASSLLILIAQIVLGGLTVLKLLHSGIVTMHLAVGTAFFGSMLWVYMNVRSQQQQSAQVRSLPVEVPFAFAMWTIFVVLIVYGQILLGGWVASNYAGLACVDFPTCNGQLLPPLIGSVGIQVIHRFGAYLTTLVLFVNLLWAWRCRRELWMSPQIVQGALYSSSLVLVQICLGVANIKFFIPPLITVLHLLTAVSLLALSLRSVFYAFAFNPVRDEQNAKLNLSVAHAPL